MWLAILAEAWAGRPLTYAEALTAAARSNALVVRGEHAVDRAEADELSARGLFDPLYTLTGTWGHLAFDEVRDALPISGTDRTWDVTTWLGGTTPTGTTYALAAGVGFDRSFATGLQPRYDEDGEQVGTAPYEANVASYSSAVSVTISQQLLRGVRLSYNLQAVRLARQARTTAELAADQVRQQAMADAALAYWTWVYFARVHDIDEAAVGVAEEAHRVARAQVEARQLAPVESTRLEAALVLARAAAIDSRVLANQARDQLLVIMGEASGQDVVPASEPGDPPAVTIEADAAIAVALAENLDVALARSALEAQELVRSGARHGRLPSLEALGSVGRSTGNQVTLSEAVTGVVGEPAQPNLSVGAVFSVPLGNRAAVGAVRAAEADLLTAESAVEELERQVGAQVAYQVAWMDASRHRIALADAGVRLGEETLAATELLVRSSRAVPKDALEARTLLDRARVEAVRARTDWRLAYTELARLQAGLTEELP